MDGLTTEPENLVNIQPMTISYSELGIKAFQLLELSLEAVVLPKMVQ